MTNPMNFNSYAQPDLAAPAAPIDAKALMQLAQAGQPTKQPASTNPQATQPPGSLNTQAARQLGNDLGAALYRMMRGPQGQQPVAPAPAPPVTWNVTPQQPQQQVGSPMQILPQGYGYR